MIQKHSTLQQNLNLRSNNPTKSCNKNNCVSTFENKMRETHNGMHSKLKNMSNTDTSKLNWRFNRIFLVITNRDSYCMLYGEYTGTVKLEYAVTSARYFLLVYHVQNEMPKNVQIGINQRLLTNTLPHL